MSNDDIFNLIYWGVADDLDPLEILKFAGKKHPIKIIEIIHQIFEDQVSDAMVIPGLAAFLSGAPEDFFSVDCMQEIYNLLLDYNAEELYLLIELVQSKIFGRGLGSRVQKLLKKIMENWTLGDLSKQVSEFPKETARLMKLIRPKFSNPEFSKIIKPILVNKLLH